MSDERSAPDLMADLIRSVDEFKRRRHQMDATLARARGDLEAERAALDQIHLLDRKLSSVSGRVTEDKETGEQ